MKSWFFERLNSNDKTFANFIKERKEKTQIHLISNEKCEITTGSAKIQTIINTYFENLYSNNMENTEEIHRFLGTYELPKMTHEDITILHNPLPVNEIEDTTKNLPIKKSSGRDGFTAELYKKFREDLMPLAPKL